MAKVWLITFYPEMAAPFTVPALASGWNNPGDLTGKPRAKTPEQAASHAAAWSLPSDERKPRVFRGERDAAAGYGEQVAD